MEYLFYFENKILMGKFLKKNASTGNRTPSAGLEGLHVTITP